MPQSFNCPQCGATNAYSGTGDHQRCEYCGALIPVPQEMVNQVAVTRLSKQATRWIVIFIVVVFVLPTCLSIAGTLIGIAASLIGALVAFFAPFFGN